jgi:RND family efflux transporter MFP subunit
MICGWRALILSRSLRLIVPGAGVVILAGCGSRQSGSPTPPPPPIVTVSKPVVREFTLYADYTGRVEAMDSLEIRARVGGFLQATHVKDGDVVEAGTLLFTIDPAPYTAVLRAKEAGVEKARAAQKLAMANIERSRPLLRSGAIPAQEFDVVAAQNAQSAADVLAAEAALESARLDVDYTRITAPFSGRLSDIKVSSGSLVAGGATASGTVLATLVSIRPVHVSFDLDEATFLRLRRPNPEGQPHSVRDQQIPVSVALGTSTDFSTTGVVDYVDPALNIGTGTLRIRGIFDNKNLSLVPGLFVRARLAMARRPDSILIPVRALNQNQNRQFVYVLDKEGAVQFRPIQPGVEQDGMVLIESGLTPEDTIVVDGALKVRPGVVPEARPVDSVTTGTTGSAPARK